jgi:hypothetical protein
MLQLDANMVHWLIQILIGLAPNQATLSAEACHHLETKRLPMETLIKTQKLLTNQLDCLTKSIVR